MSGSQVLEVTGLDVRYGPARALDEVSLTLPEGSTTAVLGVNGAGKSTLARAVSGLVPVHGGRVLVNGRLSARSGKAGDDEVVDERFHRLTSGRPVREDGPEDEIPRQ